MRQGLKGQCWRLSLSSQLFNGVGDISRHCYQNTIFHYTNKEFQTFDHQATLTALERNLGLRKVTTHSGGWTLKSSQETTRGDQEVFSYQQLRQRSKTATFQEHLMRFRPCAQMTLGETQLDLLVRGENWDQPAK